jgi:hypothetical protein
MLCRIQCSFVWLNRNIKGFHLLPYHDCNTSVILSLVDTFMLVSEVCPDSLTGISRFTIEVTCPLEGRKRCSLVDFCKLWTWTCGMYMLGFTGADCLAHNLFLNITILCAKPCT